jgi:uncharacterized ion transporter superfamily protein YfcC
MDNPVPTAEGDARVMHPTSGDPLACLASVAVTFMKYARMDL